jgi:hypothetical protein
LRDALARLGRLPATARAGKVDLIERWLAGLERDGATLAPVPPARADARGRSNGPLLGVQRCIDCAIGSVTPGGAADAPPVPPIYLVRVAD